MTSVWHAIAGSYASRNVPCLSQSRFEKRPMPQSITHRETSHASVNQMETLDFPNFDSEHHTSSQWVSGFRTRIKIPSWLTRSLIDKSRRTRTMKRKTVVLLLKSYEPSRGIKIFGIRRDNVTVALVHDSSWHSHVQMSTVLFSTCLSF